MSQSILNDLLSQLQGGASGQIAQQLGADTQTTQQAIGAALPMIQIPPQSREMPRPPAR